MNPETIIQNKCLIAASAYPDVIVMRMHSGKYRTITGDHIVQVGVPGLADSLICVRVTITPEMVGRDVCIPIAVEYKTETGRQSKEQKAWASAWQARGGIYVIVRAVDELKKIIAKIKRDAIA